MTNIIMYMVSELILEIISIIMYVAEVILEIISIMMYMVAELILCFVSSLCMCMVIISMAVVSMRQNEAIAWAVF